MELLYHYTTPDGLKGILTDKAIWATNVFFMNDATEFALGLDLASEELRRLANDCDDTEQARRWEWLETRAMHRGPRGVKPAYAASLSEQGDLLSQWRAYCPTGGFSIGFPREELSGILDAHNFALSQCIYDRESQQAHISATISESASDWVTSGVPEHWERQEGERFRVPLNWELYRVAPTLKHPAFAEEREWRMLSTPEFRPQDVGFRVRRGLLVPYVSIAMGADREFWRKVRVVVAPSSHPELARAGAEQLLGKTIGISITVRNSEVPFRHL